MNIILFIYVFLVTGTQELTAHSSRTHVFFARVNGTLKPLYIEDTDYPMNALIWEELPSASPSEFFYEDGRAHSANPFNSGTIVADIFDGFYFYEYYRGSILNLDEKKRLKNLFFYSCEEFTGFNKITTVMKYEHCFFSEIYFLPYDKATKGPVKGSYTPERDLERIPHVFFIQSNETDLEPLYSETSEPKSLGLVPFKHGDATASPLEFFVQEDYAATEYGGALSGYVGFTDHDFGYGIYHQKTNLGLDTNKRLSAGRFFSCQISGSRERTIVLNPFPGCFEVDMYLLPYNRTSRRPSGGHYVRDIDTTPHVFFIKVNRTLETLSYYTVTDAKSLKKYGIFYQQSSRKPVEFTLKNNIAFTEEASISGFAGLKYGYSLVFGGSTLQTFIGLDEKMRLKDHRIYSCAKEKNSTTRDIVFDLNLGNACVEVEIYLLPFNRTSGCPVEGSYMPEPAITVTDSDSGSSNRSIDVSHTKPMTDVHSKMSVDVPMNNGKKVSTISRSRVTHVFFTKVKNIWVPLSAKYSHKVLINVFTLSIGSTPVEFTVKNGNIYTANTFPLFYPGVYGKYFGFGIKESHKIELDGEMKVQKRFFKCKTTSPYTYLIMSIEYVPANCEEMEIYLLPYNRTSGLPMRV